MSTSIEALVWLPNQIVDGIAKLTSANISPSFIRHAPDCSKHSIEAALARAASAMNIKTAPLSSTFENLARCIAASAPMVIPTSAGAVLVERATGARATVLTPDGKRHRIRLTRLTKLLEPPLPKKTEQSISHLQQKLGPKFQLADTFRREHKQNNPVFAGWKITAQHCDGKTKIWTGSTTRKAVGLISLHVVHFALWILSWVMLISVLLGIGDRNSLLFFWVIALSSSLLILPIESLLQQDLTIRLGVIVKQNLLHNALGMNKRSVRKLGIGQLIARALEANQLDGLAIKGCISVLLIGFDTVLVIALFMWHAGIQPLLLLFLITIAISASLWKYYYRTARQLYSTRLAITALHTEEMIGHRTRKVFLGRARWHAQEGARLVNYGNSITVSNNAALYIGIIPRLWAIAGISTILFDLLAQQSATLTSVSLIGFVIIVFGILQNASQGVVQLITAIVSAEHIDEMKENTVSHDPPMMLASRELSDSSNFLVRGLRYAYSSSTLPIIRNVSFELRPGEKVLLEGESGSGKSTIGALLAGRLEPDAGTILSHGIDRNVTGNTGWLQQVCYTPQPSSNHVLTDTLAYNLLLGRSWPPTKLDLQEAYSVAEEVGLGPLMDTMPAGISQMIGEGGWRLSQGECVRLFLARGILQRAQVLILDELLSALDPISKLHILRVIENLPSKVILINHE